MLKLKRIGDEAIRDAVRKAAKDGHISDAEVKAIIRATFDGDSVTRDDLQDLLYIRSNSRSMSDKGRKLIEQFIRFVVDLNSRFKVPGRKTQAVDKELQSEVFRFMERPFNGAFTKINRYEIGLGLMAQLRDPGLINQGFINGCAPAAVLYSRASAHPKEYATFVMDLYELGTAWLGNLTIRVSDNLKSARVPTNADSPVLAIDWMTMASLRNSSDSLTKWILNKEYNSGDDKMSNNFNVIRNWLKSIGYGSIKSWMSEIDTPHAQKLAHLRQANSYFTSGHQVFLMVSADLIQDPKAKANLPNHAIVLETAIPGLTAGYAGPIHFKAFTWGSRSYDIPETGSLTQAQLLNHWFGYIAVKD